MKIHQKLALILLAAFALFAIDASPMSAQEAEAAATTRTISLATLAPPGSTWMRVFDAWNRELRRRSERGLQFRIYGGGVQGDEAEVIRKIRSGRLDAASVTAVGLAQIHRPALVFQMPGILRNYEQLDRAREALAPDMDAGFTSAGFKMLGWADVGQSRVFSTAPVRVPADMATRHPWVWRDDLVLPTFYQVVRSNPVPLQVPEVLGAIQTGRVDTAITPPVPCVALQWCSRLTHMTDMPMTIVLGGTVIGGRQWAELTPDQQTILSETATQFHQLARRNLRRDEQQALTEIRSRGATVIEVTQAQQQEWLNAGAQIRTRLVGQIADQALVDRVAAFGR
ncbi:TRAP transporter substrate-binding protein DctP [Sandaracinus amylolyticus]|uniref:TRAP-type C4-dicarboxylate transport system, periplasmic component n=1 Tax=Sandaracinus amylolyticus TaxID=927083 RepID=A0A0F6YL47_9BACT|nr:TRAP transporter substrate-binding protein DctP [Sandaracinus amylolyticus]AKF09938.1 TRAP-type C4-dicarboxylate transport system, periplasmic component [Sandaracinus amylolyticus]